MADAPEDDSYNVEVSFGLTDINTETLIDTIRKESKEKQMVTGSKPEKIP